jgi:hypothetical protein
VVIDGAPVRDDSLGTNGGASVDYSSRTWRHNPPIAAKNGDRGRIATNVLTPAQIKQAMESGHLQIVGAGEMINGQSTILLRGDHVIPLEGPVQFYVNESTYLPVRFQDQLSNGEWGSPADFTWLPPTKENLTLLTSPIPDGFKQLPG